MALAVSTYASSYSSGRTSFGAVTSLRATTPDRSATSVLSEDEAPPGWKPLSPAPASASRALTVTAPIPGDPEATIKKLETLRDTALAPPPRSAEDLALAQLAHTRIIQADARLREQEAMAQADERQARREFERDQAEAAYAQLAAEPGRQTARSMRI